MMLLVLIYQGSMAYHDFFRGYLVSGHQEGCLFEDKKAEQAAPREIMYIIYDKFPCGDQYQ
jgi:hypothetical protein